MSSTQQIEATTTAISDKCSYRWTINNYSLIKTEVGESISSPKFCLESNSKQFFILELYPEGKESAGFISLFLTYKGTDSKKKPDKLICKSTISALNGKNVISSCMIHQDFVKSPTGGQLEFFELKRISKIISKNNVTIHCNVEVLKAYESLLDSKIIKNEDGTNNSVKFNLSFLSEELSDVELITFDKNSIPAHKVILAMASPVFKAMFTHDMLENKNNSVKVTDISENVLVEMLRYIYTGDIKSTSKDLILELLAVADKYQIGDLKIKCGKLLSADMSTENAIEILIAAHTYDEKNLEDSVLKFVTDNIQSLVNSEQLNQIADPAILLNIINLITKLLPQKKTSTASTVNILYYTAGNFSDSE